jgi:NAD(P)-dependent dehydrogenase (short-subunit alcohol dehydrogenase family)
VESTSPSGRPVAFVTGASRGIGKACALDLAGAGLDVAVSARTMVDGSARLEGSDVTVPGGLDTTVAGIEAHGVEGLAVAMDLVDAGSPARAVAAVLERFGRIDVLVNNAIYQGAGTLSLFTDLTDAELRTVFEGNVFAQLEVIRAVLPQMLGRGSGTIIDMVSNAGYNDPPAKLGEGGWSIAYAMTKAAFGRVAPLLHVEHRDDGLRVFSVDPGLVVTERMEAAGRAALYTRHFEPATPEVIGRAIRWLVTDPAADELRGQVVLAQREVAQRHLLPGWPPARAS